MSDGVGMEITYSDAQVRDAVDRLMRLASSNVSGVEWGNNVVYGAVHQEGDVIHREAHEQTTFHKLRKNGSLAPRFVKKGKANFEQRHQVGSYDITIPARPYLGIDDDDVAEIDGIMARHLKQALTGGQPGGDPAFELYDAVGAAMVASTELRFRESAGPGGVPWEVSQRVLKSGGKTLVLSRRLKDSETHNVLRGAS